jgi:formate hydrogenlyase subunit 3/multisubunit Na+/H+ antiporter MnhD subunit
MSLLIALALLLPLLSLGLLALPRAERVVLPLAPLLLPVLALAPDSTLEIPLLLHSSCGVDALNRPLLLLAGIGWALAGWFAASTVRERPREFAAFWLLTMAGHTQALLGGSLSAFYFGYVVLTVAAYGLVIHSRSDEAMRAGRVYMVLAVLGEALVLSGLLALAAQYGNIAFRDLPSVPQPAAWLLVAGFAVKLGAVPLHMWLPLAHPVAPVPASAILSGLLVKAGLLGMLRFTPALDADCSQFLMAAGLLTAAWGALVGLFQSRLKTVLAYSTISQMGLALVGLGAVLQGAAPAALGLFALHHGLNKVALFLAAGHSLKGHLASLLFLLPAAALAGLPLTSGLLAKAALKQGLSGPWLVGLSLSSVATTLLLLHAWRLAREKDSGLERPHPAWIAAVAAGLVAPWLWAWSRELPLGLSVSDLLGSVWPVLLGGALYIGWCRLTAAREPRLPEGDIVVWLERLGRAVCAQLARVLDAWMDWEPRLPNLWPRARVIQAMEVTLGRLAVAGMFLLLILLALWLAAA